MQLSHDVLVLVPTREFAREHFDDLPGLCHRTSVFTGAVFGNRSEVLVVKPKHRCDVHSSRNLRWQVRIPDENGSL
jgi:hypothetical protein